MAENIGLRGHIHYRNSTASKEGYEPLYLNLFAVEIQPPERITEKWSKAKDNINLVLQNVTNVDGITVEKTPAPVEQRYKGSQRRYAGALPATTYANPKISFQVNLTKENEAYNYNFLRAWTDLIWDPLTGEMLLKRDYALGSTMTISWYNKIGQVFRRIKFRDIFPVSEIITPMFGYENGGNLFKVDMTWAADYWDEKWIKM